MNEDLFAQADSEYNRGNFYKAFHLFLKAAKRGNEDAMNRVACMYDSGEGVEYNFEKAIFWYKKAVEYGKVNAAYNLGVTFRAKGNLIESKYWFEQSLDSGFIDAALQLAKLYMICENQRDKVIFYIKKFLQQDDIFDEERDEAINILSMFERK